MSEQEEVKEGVNAGAPVEEGSSAEAGKAAGGGAGDSADGVTESGGAKKTRTKSGKYIPTGIVHVKASFNNTHVSITDPTGAVLSWSNAGRCQFKGSRKSTAFAATTVAQEAARSVLQHGMHEVEVLVQGPGAGRESAVRAIQAAGLNVVAIRDVTPVPHNGCRAPKRRRV